VVIVVGLSRKDHGSIYHKCDRRGFESLDTRTDPPNQIRQSSPSDTGGENKNKKVKMFLSLKFGALGFKDFGDFFNSLL
jgi:hypothetical protein